MKNQFDSGRSEQPFGTFKKILSIALCLSGACLLAVFTYYAGVLLSLLVDFFRTPEEVGLVQTVFQAFGVEEGVIAYESSQGSSFELALSPAILLLFAVMFVLMGLSALGGLVSGGLSLGAKMMMHPLQPKIQSLKRSESSSPAESGKSDVDSQSSRS